MLSDDVIAKAKILYDYNNLSILPKPADFLIVMGTDDLGVAKHAAEIDKVFNYPAIFISGGVSHQLSLHKTPFGGTEADVLSRIMQEVGVDPAKIFLEMRATNTGENITLTKELLLAMNKNSETGHLVHTPTMQRRALATAQRQWAEVEWSVSSENLEFEQYTKGLDIIRFIHGLVGDTFRILDYPAKGFQRTQVMPQDVKDALRELIIAGFKGRIPDNFEEVISNNR